MLPFLWQAGSPDIFACCGRQGAKIFLQKMTEHMLYPSCGRWGAKIFLQKVTDHMLPFLWQAEP